MSRLKACPFCGGEAKFETKEAEWTLAFPVEIVCTHCRSKSRLAHVKVLLSDDNGLYLATDEQEQIVEMWNNRT